MSVQKNRSLVGIFSIVMVFFIILLVFAYMTIKSLNGSSDSLGSIGGNKKIAVVEINGVIMSAKPTIEKLFKAERNSSVKAIILRINSPGGAVGPVQEIYAEVVRIDKKIPIYASFGVISASGGYYIGSAAREIYCNAGTLTGSIGVIMDFMDLSKIYEFARVKAETIKAGKYKDAGHPGRSMTDEEKGIFQKTMNIVHKQFINDILSRRKDRIKGDIWAIAQGQVFSGEEALGYGLVDHMGSLWKAGRDIQKKLKIKGDLNFYYIKRKKKFNMLDMMQSIEDAVTPLKWKALFNHLPMFMAN